MLHRVELPEPSTSTFWQRVRTHKLKPEDNKPLLISGGVGMGLSATGGAITGGVTTGLTSQALLYSLAFAGMAFGAMCFMFLLYRLHGYCGETPVEAASRRALLPR